MKPAALKSRNSHSSNEKSNSGFKTFFAFGLMACVLGLSVKVFFAPERLTPLLKDELAIRLPQFQIGFKSVELVLANGVLPAFSFEIKDVEISYKKNCGVVIPPIRIQKAKLPISIFKLFERKLAFSTISVQKIEMDIEAFQNKCGERSGASVATSLSPAVNKKEPEGVPSPGERKDQASEPTKSAVHQPQEIASKPENVFWSDEKLSKVSEVVSGIEFDEIKFFFDQHQKHFIFKNFLLRQKTLENSLKVNFRLKSEFILPAEYSQGEVLPPAFIDADLSSDKMNVEISTQISEGNVQMNAVVKPGSSSPVLDLSMKAKQLPVSAMAHYLTKLELLPAKIQPKFVWLSFSAAIRGRLDQLKQLPIEVNDVLIDGEFGQASISHLLRNADGSLSEFVLDLPKVQVQKAFDLIGTKGPDGIFSQFGELNGQFVFKSPKLFEFKGEWQDAVLKFSRHGSRSEQQIENLKFNLAFSDNRWRGKISNIELENGDFDGDVRLNFDHAFDEGDIEIVNENLEFDPVVQKNMFAGAVSGIKLNAKMNMKKLIIHSWDGDLQIRSLEADDLSFKQAKFLSHFSNDKLTITAKIAEGELKYNSEIRKHAKQVFLNFEDRNENLVFTNLKAEIVQSDGKWSWKSLRSSLLDDRIQISSFGGLGDEDSLSGEMNLDFPKAKKLVWQFQGNWDQIKFIPTSTNLKSLLNKKADFTSLGLNIKE